MPEATTVRERRFVREATPAERLRSALSRFATGVCVVTLRVEGAPHGLTVNSFTSVSLEPPLVLVSVGKQTRGHAHLAGRPFAVNVLGAEQQAVALHFAGRPQEGVVRWVDGARAPRLEGALAYFECEPWAAYEGGDHTLFVGRVEEHDCRPGEALGYYRSRFLFIEEESLGIEYVL